MKGDLETMRMRSDVELQLLLQKDLSADTSRRGQWCTTASSNSVVFRLSGIFGGPDPYHSPLARQHAIISAVAKSKVTEQEAA